MSAERVLVASDDEFQNLDFLFNFVGEWSDFLCYKN